MRCVLVLQLPTPDLRHGHVITASTNLDLIRQFCAIALADQEERVQAAEDVFEREFQHIRLEQLRAQLAWAMGDLGLTGT